jgi:chemotaxis protein methyltransferase CheR
MGFPDDSRPTMRSEELRLLSDLVRAACGVPLREDLKFIAERRLWPRLEALGLTDFTAYHRYLRFDARAAEELEVALELLLPHETYFFREPAQLLAFTGEVLPRLLGAPRRALRLWSAGCSTGEEPYTLAMLLEESGRAAGLEVDVLGTDLSARSLQVARKAEYGTSALRATSPERVARHFVALPSGRFAVAPRARPLVSFAQKNLLDGPGLRLLPRMDVIFCRNVLIYFEAEVRRRVVRAFYEQLAPGGFLLLGHSENLLQTSTDFEVVQLQGDLVYRRPA